MEAADCASNCFGFNPEVIRRSASAYAEVASCYSEDELVDDDCITQILSSSRGQNSSSTDTLVHDEDFRLGAHTYIRTHACRRGEPNLTG